MKWEGQVNMVEVGQFYLQQNTIIRIDWNISVGSFNIKLSHKSPFTKARHHTSCSQQSCSHVAVNFCALHFADRNLLFRATVKLLWPVNPSYFLLVP